MQHHAGYAGDKGVKVEMEADTEGAGAPDTVKGGDTQF